MFIDLITDYDTNT